MLNGGRIALPPFFLFLQNKKQLSAFAVVTQVALVMPDVSPVGVRVVPVVPQITLIVVDVALVVIAVGAIVTKVALVGINVVLFFPGIGEILVPDILGPLCTVLVEIAAVVVDVALIAVAVGAVLAEIAFVAVDIPSVFAEVAAILPQIAPVAADVAIGWSCGLRESKQGRQGNENQNQQTASHRVFSCISSYRGVIFKFQSRHAFAAYADGNPSSGEKFRKKSGLRK